MTILNWIDVLNSIFLIYACLLIIIYLYNAILSIIEMQEYSSKNRYNEYKSMLSFERLPAVSVIAPAYNEEKTIIENINGLLSLQYTNFEIIIVNDGSSDNTLKKIIDYYDLVKVNLAYQQELETEPILGIYNSKNPAYNQLIVIDKVNGGKSDALNAGINIAKNELFLAMDVDCIVEPDALLKMVKPFLDNTKHEVIASGGVIRIANSCKIKDGKIAKVNYPKNFWVKFQVIEYFRAFTLSRMAWSKINGLMIISGAFGMFDKKRVIKIGGYDRNSIGEDLELVVRLRRYMHEVEKIKYKVAFIPDPLCWTEVPENINDLTRQRNRWTRGAIDTIIKHRKMFLNPKYKLIGMVSFPYWVIFEWLAPIIQTIGFVFFALIIYFNLLNLHVFLTLLLFVFTFAAMYSLFAIFFESYTFHKYKGVKYFSQSALFIFLEMFIYQPLNMYFSLSGHFDYYFKKDRKRSWGEVTRKGFNETKS